MAEKNTETQKEKQEILSEEAQKFLKEFKEEQQQVIETRKNIEDLMFFLSCQISSVSLASILFNYVVGLNVISWLCLFIANLPAISQANGISIEKTEHGWRVVLMKNPFRMTMQFVSGTVLTFLTIKTYQGQIEQTEELINGVYDQIERYETPKVDSFLSGGNGTALVCSISITLLLVGIKMMRGDK